MDEARDEAYAGKLLARLNCNIRQTSILAFDILYVEVNEATLKQLY